MALALERDQYHAQALALKDRLEQEGAGVVTTRPVVLEIANFLSTSGLRSTGVRYLNSLQRDPATEIIPLSNGLFERGFKLYGERQDKDWSLTDCISFVVMRERGLTDALTADQHFEQAGFNALLRE